jgi:hypothetical protein
MTTDRPNRDPSMGYALRHCFDTTTAEGREMARVAQTVADAERETKARRQGEVVTGPVLDACTHGARRWSDAGLVCLSCGAVVSAGVAR